MPTGHVLKEVLSAMVLTGLIVSSLSAIVAAQGQAPNFQGTVDICGKSGVAGWAVEGYKGAILDVKVNGKVVGKAKPGLLRPDVAKAVINAPINAGFEFKFAPALKAADTVEVTFANGQQLVNSPCKKLD